MTTTSPERDELFQLILGRTTTKAVERILAAGFRKPRTVTTVDELESLPFGSVILDRAGLSLHKNEFTGWRASNGAKNVSREMLENEALPATVLHVGTPVTRPHLPTHNDKDAT